jgi:two-component system chemotaxis response regulator CheB
MCLSAGSASSNSQTAFLTDSEKETPVRVLIVDDSKPVRSILGKMLRELEFEVSEACNGKEGLELLEQLDSVDLATVNWNMPVMDGLTFVRKIRSLPRFRKLPVVMVTSESEPTKKELALQAGADDYIVKPFTKNTLCKTLRGLGLAAAEPVTAADAQRPSSNSTPVRAGKPIRVLIVDDSVIIRRTVSKVIEQDPALTVAGTAADGRIALNALNQVQPDVVVLDVEMPNLNGFETLKALRKTHPLLPVVMFSALTERGAAATLDALMLGANDYVPKPTQVSDFEVAQQCIRDELIPKIIQFTRVPAVEEKGVQPLVPAPSTAPERQRQRIELVVVAVSTGGPVALATLLPKLKVNQRVPVMIVQHMPPLFTQHLATRLASLTGAPVHEAHDRQPLLAGHFYIAPGGFHMQVTRSGETLQVRLNQDPPQNSCRPAADVLFQSAATVTRDATLAVVLTGMGRDGLQGCQAIAAVGGQVVAQDEATSVVWGMPGQVARAGLAQAVLPIDRLGDEILRRLSWRG